MVRKILFTMLIVCLMPSPVIIAQDAESTETPEVVAEHILDDAQDLVDEAKSLLDQNFRLVETLFNLIQAGGVLLAFIAVLAGVVSAALGLRARNDFLKEIEALRQQVASAQNLREEFQLMQDEQKQYAVTQMQAISLVQLAIQEISIGNHDAALNTLERANELQENNPAINYFRGEVLVREGHYESGIEYLEKAIENITLPDANATIAYACRMLGDANPDKRDKYYSNAESIYVDLREKYPNLLDISGESVYGALAGLYRNRNMIDKAIQTYEEIARMTPNSSYPVNNLGLLHFEHDEKPFADRDEGQRYFEISRRKVRARLKLEGTDYWQLFDLITAEIALEETSWDEIQGLLDNMFDLEPIDDDVQKLQRGLLQLQLSEQPPALVDQALGYIESKMGRTEPGP